MKTRSYKGRLTFDQKGNGRKEEWTRVHAVGFFFLISLSLLQVDINWKRELWGCKIGGNRLALSSSSLILLLLLLAVICFLMLLVIYV